MESRQSNGTILTGVILAGGQSVRMGSDKALLTIDGQPLLRQIVLQMRAAGMQDIIIAAGDGSREAIYREALAHLDHGGRILFVCDEFPGYGPLSGLHAALSAMQGGHAFVMACDMPVLSVSLLARMREYLNNADVDDVIRIPAQPFHAIYSPRIVPRLRFHLERDDRRVMQVIKGMATQFIQPTPEEELGFVNLNTPEHYERYMAQFANE